MVLRLFLDGVRVDGWRRRGLSAPVVHVSSAVCSSVLRLHVPSHNIRCLKEFSHTFRPKLVSQLISEE